MTILERFIAEIRARMETRLWTLLGQSVNGDQQSGLEKLLTITDDGGRQGSQRGDTFGYNVALSHAFVVVAKNNLFVDSNNAPWTAVLELNGMWQDRQKTAHLIDPNSGGNTVYVSSGIRYAGGKNWNTALSIGTPIVKE